MSIRERLRGALSTSVTLIILFVGRASLADHYRVPSGSMEPTIHTGDHVWVDKMAYGLRVPFTSDYVAKWGTMKRGDVVVLDSPESPSIVLLKRIVAVGGDHVDLRDGVLTLNGKPLRSGDAHVEFSETGPHALGVNYGNGPDFGPVDVPPGYVLVLGDNRGNSRDGRFFGFVREGAVLGRVEQIVWRDGRLRWMVPDTLPQI